MPESLFQSGGGRVNHPRRLLPAPPFHSHDHFSVSSSSTCAGDAAGGKEWSYSSDISTAACPGLCNINCNCDSSRAQHCHMGPEACGQERRDCSETSTALDLRSTCACPSSSEAAVSDTCPSLRFGGAPETPSMLEGLKESLRP